jgi:hypothetical protein
MNELGWEPLNERRKEQRLDKHFCICIILEVSQFLGRKNVYISLWWLKVL